MNLTPNQLAVALAQLFHAYYKNNGFGTDEAEIYAYTLVEGSPATIVFAEHEKKQGFQAAKNLYEVICLFKSLVGPCHIFVNTLDYLDWWSQNPCLLHRAHVQVLAGTKEDKPTKIICCDCGMKPANETGIYCDDCMPVLSHLDGPPA